MKKRILCFLAAMAMCTLPAGSIAQQTSFEGAINASIGPQSDITMNDEGWIGLGAAKGRFVFNDETVDDITMSGGNLIIGDAAGQIILPQSDDPVTPTLSFGDGDSGFYETSDDSIIISFAESAVWTITSLSFQSGTSGGAALGSAASSSTVPALTFTGDTDTGIGLQTTDSLSLISGGSESVRHSTTATTMNRDVNMTSGSLDVGVSDTLVGQIRIFGDSDTIGGGLFLYNGANDDTNMEWCSFKVNGDLVNLSMGGSNLFQWQWNSATSVQYEIGSNGSAKGEFIAFGDNSSNGGEVTLYNADSEDTNISVWHIEADDDELLFLGDTKEYFSINWSSDTNVGIEAGTSDAIKGNFIAYGDNSTNGGVFFIYNAASEDGTINVYDFEADGTTLSLSANSTGGTLNLTNMDLTVGGGDATFGVADTTQGKLSLAGDNADTGAQIFMSNSANEDTNVDYWVFDTIEDSFQLRAVNLNVLKATWTSATSVGVIIGSSDSAQGYLTLSGDNANSGASVSWYNAANEDATMQRFLITANALDFEISGSAAGGTLELVNMALDTSGTLTTAANVAWDFGAATTAVPTPDSYLTVVVAGTTYRISADAQ